MYAVTVSEYSNPSPNNSKSNKETNKNAKRLSLEDTWSGLKCVPDIRFLYIKQ